MDLGTYQNKLKDLPALSRQRYENIFKVYKNDKGQYYYNINKSIVFPENIDKTKVSFITVKQKQAWTTISYNVYGTIELWWLICLLNKIDNPIKQPEPGTVLKVLNYDALNDVLVEIQGQIKQT